MPPVDWTTPPDDWTTPPVGSTAPPLTLVPFPPLPGLLPAPPLQPSKAIAKNIATTGPFTARLRVILFCFFRQRRRAPRSACSGRTSKKRFRKTKRRSGAAGY
jgi:hypothetical protein